MGKNKEEWENTLEALKSTHTISIRRVCEELKASRPWVNEYIKDNVDSIYLNSNIRGSAPGKGANWVLLASIALGRDYMQESVWLNEKKYRKLIENSIVSVTKQTKKIPIELLVKNPAEYEHMYNSITMEINAQRIEIAKNRTISNYVKLSKLMKMRDRCHVALLSDLGNEVLTQIPPDATKRSGTKAIDYKVEKIPEIMDWTAPHDIKKYGDTDEMIYRKIFNEGKIKITLQLEGKKQKPSKKIYYIDDDKPIIAQRVSEYYLVSEEYYQKELKERL